MVISAIIAVQKKRIMQSFSRWWYSSRETLVELGSILKEAINATSRNGANPKARFQKNQMMAFIVVFSPIGSFISKAICYIFCHSVYFLRLFRPTGSYSIELHKIFRIDLIGKLMWNGCEEKGILTLSLRSQFVSSKNPF
jgi:hypothetical protein